MGQAGRGWSDDRGQVARGIAVLPRGIPKPAYAVVVKTYSDIIATASEACITKY